MNRPLNRPMITLSIMLATIMPTLDGHHGEPPRRAVLAQEAPPWC